MCGPRPGDLVGVGGVSPTTKARARVRFHDVYPGVDVASWTVLLDFGKGAGFQDLTKNGDGTGLKTRLDGLSECERSVYEALPARGLRSVEQVSVTAGLPVERVLGPLAMLEVSGLVEKVDGRWRLVKC